MNVSDVVRNKKPGTRADRRREHRHVFGVSELARPVTVPQSRGRRPSAGWLRDPAELFRVLELELQVAERYAGQEEESDPDTVFLREVVVPVSARVATTADF